MKKRKYNIIWGLALFAIAITSCNTKSSNTKTLSTQENHSLPYIIDMVHDNPGEDLTQTQYRDPKHMKEIGFNSIIYKCYAQCALTYKEFDPNLFNDHPKDLEWIQHQKEISSKAFDKIKKEGLNVYAFVDMLVLPKVLLEKYKNQLVGEKVHTPSGFNAIHGKLVPDINQPLTQKLIQIQMKELFDTFPQLDGIVIRFGETYLFDTPFHAGGSPIGGKEGQAGIDGHVQLINLLKKSVCEDRNKMLFYRTWDFGFMHTDPKVYKTITDQIEPNKNLIFSIKYSAGDFHRLIPFNPTLGVGKHPYIVEFQCQPEYYGKCSHPVYVFGGMLRGWEEFSQINPSDRPNGIEKLKGDPRFKGLWTWSRGGGWRGPYITNEMWCDLNLRTAAAWAKDTTRTEKQCLDIATTQMGVNKNDQEKLERLVRLTEDGIVRGHCTLIDLPKSDMNIFWTRDHFLGGTPLLKPFFKYVVDHHESTKAMLEKRKSVEIWKEIEALSQEIHFNKKEDTEYIQTSATYGRIKYQIMQTAFEIMLIGYIGDQTKQYNKDTLKKDIQQYDALWEEWNTLKQEHPSCATLYKPLAFEINDKGAFGTKENGMQKSIDHYRTLIQ